MLLLYQLVRNVSAQSIKGARIPSIKFRYGTRRIQSSQPQLVTSSSSQPSMQSFKAVQYQLSSDMQLPPRLKRKPIDEVEMDYINRGGPA